MSVFTNPQSRSKQQSAEYVAAVLELLGDRNPMDVLTKTPEALKNVLEDVSHDQASQPEAEGKWSIRQILQHLTDSELVWGYRLRMVLAQKRVRLTGYDQDEWAARLGYEQSDPSEAVREFSMLRKMNLRLLERATPEDLKRAGTHAERGRETVAHMMKLYAGHDILHLRQIERVRQATAQ